MIEDCNNIDIQRAPFQEQRTFEISHRKICRNMENRMEIMKNKKKSVESKSRGTTRRYYILTIILRWSVKMRKKKGKNKAGGWRVGIKLYRKIRRETPTPKGVAGELGWRRGSR